MEKQSDALKIKSLIGVLNYYKFVLIIAAILITGIYALYVNESNEKTVSYKATSSIYVSEKSVEANVVGGADNHIMQDYISLIQGNYILDDVINSLKLKESKDSLSAMMQVSSEENSHIISISVLNSNAELAESLANNIASIAVKKLSRESDYYDVSIVTNANSSTIVQATNIWIPVFKCFCIIVVILLLITIFIYIMCDNIKSEDLLEQNSNIEILERFKADKFRPYKKQSILKKIEDKFRKIQWLIGNEYKTIIVTSPNKNKGKSFITTGIASAFFCAHKRTLLIDMSAGKQRISNSYKEQANKVSLDDIWEERTFTSFDILELNEQQILEVDSKDELNILWTKLKSMYDHVIIDSGEMESFSNYLLFNYIDAALIVLNPNKTSEAQVLKLQKKLNANGCKVIGMMLNEVLF